MIALDILTDGFFAAVSETLADGLDLEIMRFPILLCGHLR